MRATLGRLIGSAATGGLVTLVAWYLFGSLLAAVLAGVIASVFVMFSDSITSPAPGRRRRGGGWSGGGYGGPFSRGGGPRRRFRAPRRGPAPARARCVAAPSAALPSA